MLSPSILPFDEKFDLHVNSFLAAQGNHLFNEPAYFRLHSRSEQDCYAQLVRRNDQQVFATLAFHAIASSVFVSPGRGTYGGLSLNAEIELQVLDRFVAAVVAHLRAQGARSVRVRCAPASHDGTLFAMSVNMFSRLGFQPREAELNNDMRIDGRTFIERTDYGNVKRIRKTEREGFVCDQLEEKALPAVHALLAENRVRLGVSISMSLEQVRQMAALFPQRLHLFGVYRDASRQEMVAAAMCLAVSQQVLYVLYWGDGPGMRSYSPVAMLASHIYAFCAREGFAVLDVGISTLHEEPNFGLVNFKRNLGFTESMKLEMAWHGGPDMEER
jgi:hypothetical protein